MKKYFKLLTVLFLLMITVNVNAEDNFFVEKTREIDYSKITFKDANGNDITHDPAGDLLGVLEFSTTYDANNNLTNTKYSYCLDKNMKYPEGYHEFAKDGTGTKEAHAKAIARFGLMRELANQEALRNLFKNKIGTHMEIGPTLEFSTEFVNNLDNFISTFTAGNEVTVAIKNVTYDQGYSVTGAEMNNALGKGSDEYYTYTFKKSDIMYINYSVTPFENTYNYNHALWILEHSYPTLSVKEALELAGADITTLKSEIEALHSGETIDVDKKIEDYVFVVVQFSIWKATGATVDGVKIGNSLTGVNGVELKELNKLYQFLIQDRDIYTNYGSLTYANTIEFVKPAAGKEVYSTNNGIIKYGPYAIDAKVVSTAEIKLEVTDSYKDKVKIVDKLGNEITKFENGLEFYISVPKSEKISEINLKATADNALVFEPAENRGKIYYSRYPFFQNVVVGGKVNTTSVVGTIKLQYNPSTGVTNVALLFVVTMVAFGIGYLVLNYKNKPVTF